MTALANDAAQLKKGQLFDRPAGLANEARAGLPESRNNGPPTPTRRPPGSPGETAGPRSTRIRCFRETGETREGRPAGTAFISMRAVENIQTIDGADRDLRKPA